MKTRTCVAVAVALASAVSFFTMSSSSAAQRPVSSMTVRWHESRSLKGARRILARFDQAVVRNDATSAKTYLAADFRGRCGGSQYTSRAQPLRVILCRSPRPTGFNIFSVEREGASGAGAVTMFRVAQGHMQPLTFILAFRSHRWRITWIGPVQG